MEINSKKASVDKLQEGGPKGKKQTNHAIQLFWGKLHLSTNTERKGNYREETIPEAGNPKRGDHLQGGVWPLLNKVS